MNKKTHKSKKKLFFIIAVIFIISCFALLNSQVVTAYVIHSYLPSTRNFDVLAPRDYQELLSVCRKEIERAEVDYPVKEKGDNCVVSEALSPVLPDPHFYKVMNTKGVYRIVKTPLKIRIDFHACPLDCAHYGLVVFKPGIVPVSADDIVDSKMFSYPHRKSLEDGAVEIYPGVWYYDTKLVGEKWLRKLLVKYFKNN